MKKEQIILLAILLIILGAILIFFIEDDSDIDAAEVEMGGREFILEFAETPEEQAKGLMFRESLEEDKGMLFVYDNIAPRLFWMKNTYIPLDLIFIAGGKIVDIKQGFQPCLEDCQTYESLPARYVIEINAGLVEELGIEKGQEINLKI